MAQETMLMAQALFGASASDRNAAVLEMELSILVQTLMFCSACQTVLDQHTAMAMEVYNGEDLVKALVLCPHCAAKRIACADFPETIANLREAAKMPDLRLRVYDAKSETVYS